MLNPEQDFPTGPATTGAPDAPAQVDDAGEIDAPPVVAAPLVVIAPAVVNAPAVDDAPAVVDAPAAVDAPSDVDTATFEHLVKVNCGYYKNLSSLIEKYTKIMEMNPEKRLSNLTRIGCIYTMMGRFEEAIATFKTVFKTDPNSLSALNGISDALIKYAKAKSEEKQYLLAKQSTQLAVDYLIKALTITKKFSSFWKLLGAALFLLSNLPDCYCFVELKFDTDDDIGIKGYLTLKKTIYKLSEFCYWYAESTVSPHYKRFRGRVLTAVLIAAEESYVE